MDGMVNGLPLQEKSLRRRLRASTGGILVFDNDIMHRKHNTTQQPFYRPLSGTTRVSWYQKKHSPTHHPDHHPIFIGFFHLPRSIASSLFPNYVLGNLFAQPLSMSSLVYLLVWSPPPHIPYISSPISVSSFHSTCPYHCNLFRCSINIICIGKYHPLPRETG